MPSVICKPSRSVSCWIFFNVRHFGTKYSGPSLIRIAWDQSIQISEILGLVKATAATCVIVTAPYLHSVLVSLGSLPLLHVHRTHNTAPKLSFSTLLIHLPQNMTCTPKF